MKRHWILSFNKEQQVEIERQLQYINFISRREFPTTPNVDNVLALFDAIMLLSNAEFAPDRLHAMLANLDDNSPQAVFVRRYYDLIGRFLLADVSLSVDESSIVELYRTLYAVDDIASPRPLRRIMNVAPQRARRQSAEELVANDRLSELVEWLLARTEAETLTLVDAAIFLHRIINARIFEHNAEPLMHLLMLLLMRRVGCAWIIHCAPAQVMARDCVAYRRALLLDEAAWVEYYIASVYTAAQGVSALFVSELPPHSASHKTVLNPRQRAILEYIGHHQPVKLSAIVGHLHKESVNTVKKDLLHLRTLGFITADGVLKGTVYYKN